MVFHLCSLLLLSSEVKMNCEDQKFKEAPRDMFRVSTEPIRIPWVPKGPQVFQSRNIPWPSIRGFSGPLSSSHKFDSDLLTFRPSRIIGCKL